MAISKKAMKRTTAATSRAEALVAEVEPARFDPITIDPALCIGCDRCVEACQVDVFVPSLDADAPPIVAYPGECWHSGDCVVVCPVPGAIVLEKMIENNVEWKRKATGEVFSLIKKG